MAGESYFTNDTDQEFRYTSLEFADQNNQANYAHYQRQVSNNNTAHTRLITNSKKELSNNLKKTRNDALLKMISIKKEYLVKEGQAKLDKTIENIRKFSSFVNGVDFDDQQIQGLIVGILLNHRKLTFTLDICHIHRLTNCKLFNLTRLK